MKRKVKKQFTKDSVAIYWEKAPWAAGCWVLYLKPKDWVYPALYLYVNTLTGNYFKHKRKKTLSHGLIMHTYVHPAARKQGLARLALKEVTTWLDVVATCAATAYSAKILRKFGFVLDPLTKQYVFTK